MSQFEGRYSAALRSELPAIKPALAWKNPTPPRLGWVAFLVVLGAIGGFIIPIRGNLVNAAEIQPMGFLENICVQQVSEDQPGAKPALYPHRRDYGCGLRKKARLTGEHVEASLDFLGGPCGSFGWFGGSKVKSSREWSVQGVLPLPHIETDIRRGGGAFVYNRCSNYVTDLSAYSMLNVYRLATPNLDFRKSQVGLQLPVLRLSTYPKLEQRDSGIDEDEQYTSDFQRGLEELGILTFMGASILATWIGVRLCQRSRPLGLVLICIAFLLFFAAWASIGPVMLL